MLFGLLALALIALAGVVAFFGIGARWLNDVWVGLPALGAWVSAQLDEAGQLTVQSLGLAWPSFV